MAKKNKPEGKKYSYMDTYGDLVTLLLCFFVLLFSMSTVEEQKYNAFVEALSQRFGSTPTNFSFVSQDAPESGSQIGDAEMEGDMMDPEQILPADFTQLHQAISEYVQENGMEGEVSIEKSDNGSVFIRLSDNLLFDGNSATLKNDTAGFLDFLGDCFGAVQEQILQVNFKGHTASVQGSDVDDWNLSAERASKVSSYLNNIGGFNRFKINLSGYGRNYPVADNELAEGRAKNRRVDIIVLSNKSDNLEAALLDAMRVYFPTDTTEFFQGDPGDLPEDVVNNVLPEGGEAATVSGLLEASIQVQSGADASALGAGDQPAEESTSASS